MISGVSALFSLEVGLWAPQAGAKSAQNLQPQGLTHWVSRSPLDDGMAPFLPRTVGLLPCFLPHVPRGPLLSPVVLADCPSFV